MAVSIDLNDCLGIRESHQKLCKVCLGLLVKLFKVRLNLLVQAQGYTHGLDAILILIYSVSLDGMVEGDAHVIVKKVAQVQVSSNSCQDSYLVLVHESAKVCPKLDNEVKGLLDVLWMNRMQASLM